MFKATIVIRKSFYHYSCNLLGEAKLRTPLIKFIGKRSLVKGGTPTAVTARPSNTSPTVRSSSTSTVELGVMYGRPVLSDMEKEFIESGGATIIF